MIDSIIDSFIASHPNTLAHIKLASGIHKEI